MCVCVSVKATIRQCWHTHTHPSFHFTTSYSDAICAMRSMCVCVCTKLFICFFFANWLNKFSFSFRKSIFPLTPSNSHSHNTHTHTHSFLFPIYFHSIHTKNPPPPPPLLLLQMCINMWCVNKCKSSQSIKLCMSTKRILFIICNAKIVHKYLFTKNWLLLFIQFELNNINTHTHIHTHIHMSMIRRRKTNFIPKLTLISFLMSFFLMFFFSYFLLFFLKQNFCQQLQQEERFSFSMLKKK